MFAPLAEFDAAEVQLPAARQSSSDDLPWRSVLARTYLERPHADEFTTLPTTSLLVVLITGGVYAIESRNGRRWAGTVYRTGSAGLTAPGNASTLRWRSMGREPMTSLHLYLAPDLFVDVVDGRRAATVQSLPDALAADDPTVATVGSALSWALESKASALYADSAAQFLAAHLMERSPRSLGTPAGRGLGDKALNDVVEYMHAHLADDVSLEHLGAVARLSKFHFLRSFKASTGVTPHRFLVEIRMARAAELLRGTHNTVSWVAAQCGYRSDSHFAAAFAQRVGMPPAQYREERRRR